MKILKSAYFSCGNHDSVNSMAVLNALTDKKTENSRPVTTLSEQCSQGFFNLTYRHNFYVALGLV